MGLRDILGYLHRGKGEKIPPVAQTRNKDISHFVDNSAIIIEKCSGGFELRVGLSSGGDLPYRHPLYWRDLKKGDKVSVVVREHYGSGDKRLESRKIIQLSREPYKEPDNPEERPDWSLIPNP